MSPFGSSNLPIPTACFRKHKSEPLLNRDLFDLSTHKVYPALSVTTETVSSYLTISPFPHSEKSARGSLISVALSVNLDFNRNPLPVRKYDALRCPDFPSPRCDRENDKAT